MDETQTDWRDREIERLRGRLEAADRERLNAADAARWQVRYGGRVPFVFETLDGLRCIDYDFLLPPGEMPQFLKRPCRFDTMPPRNEPPYNALNVRTYMFSGYTPNKGWPVYRELDNT